MIEPGLVRNIQYQGNVVTSPRVIASAISIKQGDTLKTGTLAKTMSDIYATGLFKNVNIEFDSAGTVRSWLKKKSSGGPDSDYATMSTTSARVCAAGL